MTEDTTGRFDHEREITLIKSAAEIVAAAVAARLLQRDEIPALISTTKAALARVVSNVVNMEAPKLSPAIDPKKSIQDDRIICLEDGKAFKSLKRHLRTSYGLTPDEYRSKWGLPADYPMVAPNYAAQRSQLAKSMGLGRTPRPRPKAA